jgi:hypothetical protein
MGRGWGFRWYDRGDAAPRTSGLGDPDVTWAAELAGRLTEWAGQSGRPRDVYEIALAQWRGLGDARGAARIERTLLGL